MMRLLHFIAFLLTSCLPRQQSLCLQPYRGHFAVYLFTELYQREYKGTEPGWTNEKLGKETIHFCSCISLVTLKHGVDLKTSAQCMLGEARPCFNCRY